VINPRLLGIAHYIYNPIASCLDQQLRLKLSLIIYFYNVINEYINSLTI
jgi:hypothetical protein